MLKFLVTFIEERNSYLCPGALNNNVKRWNALRPFTANPLHQFPQCFQNPLACFNHVN
jgi:hypothetical protein